MRPSRLSTRGTSLLEVIVVVTIFASVIAIIANQQVEATNVTKVATASTDLRTIGEGLLEQMRNVLQSSQVRFVSCRRNALQTYRVIGIDTAASAPNNCKFELASGNRLIYEYSQASSSDATTSVAGSSGIKYGTFLLARYRDNAGTRTLVSAGVPLSRELEFTGNESATDPNDATRTIGLGGFIVERINPGVGTVTWTTFAANSTGFALTELGPNGGNGASPDTSGAPVTLRLQLTLKRKIGVIKNSGGTLVDHVVRVNVQTCIDMKPATDY